VRQLFIDGKFVDAASGETMDIINPADGAVIGTLSEGRRRRTWAVPCNARTMPLKAVLARHAVHRNALVS